MAARVVTQFEFTSFSCRARPANGQNSSSSLPACRPLLGHPANPAGWQRQSRPRTSSATRDGRPHIHARTRFSDRQNCSPRRREERPSWCILTGWRSSIPFLGGNARCTIASNSRIGEFLIFHTLPRHPAQSNIWDDPNVVQIDFPSRRQIGNTSQVLEKS
jgi:hypothetical protein